MGSAVAHGKRRHQMAMSTRQRFRQIGIHRLQLPPKPAKHLNERPEFRRSRHPGRSYTLAVTSGAHVAAATRSGKCRIQPHFARHALELVGTSVSQFDI